MITQLYDRHLAAENLRTTQYSILSKLGRLGPLPMNALAQSMAMDRTTLGRAVQPLERDRLIAIAADRDDRRVRIVRLTQAGQAGCRPLCRIGARRSRSSRPDMARRTQHPCATRSDGSWKRLDMIP